MQIEIQAIGNACCALGKMAASDVKRFGQVSARNKFYFGAHWFI